MKYRIELSKNEYDVLIDIINTYGNDFNEFYDDLDKGYTYGNLVEKIENPRLIKESEKKELAALNATRIREKRTREKIQNAINILRMENKEITPHRVSKVSGVSFQTAQKYLNIINENKEKNSN